MWCPNCRSDVAAEVSTDNRHVNCATCGGPIATPLSGRTLSRTQQARDLLERWSRDRAPEPATAVAKADVAKAPAAVGSGSGTGSGRSTPVYSIQQDGTTTHAEQHDRSPRSGFEPSKTQRRMDDGHLLARSVERQDSEYPKQPQRDTSEPAPPRSKQPVHRRDDAHVVAGPHVRFPAKSPTKWVSLIGQSLAYVGVLGLMAGACLVILGYFRGPATYAPTGWLITMAGQMLLFLGVVTLVSNGMEETTNTVANRIDRLDEKLLRIEKATSELRGPRGGTDGYQADAEKPPAQREISRAG